MKSVFYLPIIFVISLFVSCGGDGEYYTYNYYQQIRFLDTNEVIRTIYYPQINKTDIIDSLYTNLRVSENFPTIFQVKSDKSIYTFKIQMKFKYKDESSYSTFKNIQRIYDGIEILETNASEVKITRSYGHGQNYYSRGYDYLIDLITLK